MGPRKPIVWTDLAKAQRRAILEYWLLRNQSDSYPRKIIKAIGLRLDQLSAFPKSGKPTTYKGVQVVAMGYFSIFYRDLPERIVIVLFWDNRQDPNRLQQLLDAAS